MKEVSLSGSVRKNVGKKDAKAVRNSGFVPCVVYGTGKQQHFSVKHTDMEKLLFTPNVYIINLDLEGTTVKTIIQETQYHPVTDRIQHIDFIELQSDKKIKVNIPVLLKGRSKGVLNGGRLMRIFRKLKVYSVPGELPDSIEIDITELKIGDAVRISDLIKDGLEFLHSPNAVVVSVKTARNIIEEEEEEEEVELDEDGNPIEKPEGEGEGAEGEGKKEGGDDKPAEGGGDNKSGEGGKG